MGFCAREVADDEIVTPDVAEKLAGRSITKAAIRFKQVLDEIGHVTSEIITSAPDDREGNEEADKESKDLVRKFWVRMMARYPAEEEYNRQITEAFLSSAIRRS